MALHRPARQIEVFDISLMAVVTKAMGAFLVLTVLLLPYYRSDPDVATTSFQARQALEDTRRQLEDIARSLGANPNDAEALRRALEAMRNALAAADRKLSDLAKQADELSSQLKEARRDLEVAKARAEKAIAAYRQAQTVAAEMEAAANERARAARSAQIAMAETEDAANSLLQVLGKSALAVRWMMMIVWTPEASCADAEIRLSTYRSGATLTLPEGVRLEPLGSTADGYMKRSSRVQGTALLEPDAGAGRSRMLYFSTSFEEHWREFIYVTHGKPLTDPCKISMTANVIDLLNQLQSRLTLPEVPIPAGTDATALVMADSDVKDHFSSLSEADRAEWATRAPSLGGSPGRQAPAPSPDNGAR